MAKKNISKIAAIALAGATAFSTLAMTVSADLNLSTDGNSVSGTVYKYVYNKKVGEGITQPVTVYYTTKEAAAAAKEATNGTYSSVSVTTVGTYVTVSDGVVTKVESGTTGAYKTTGSTSTGTTDTSTSISTAYRYATDTVYYSTLTNTYYPNLAALKYAEGSHTSYTTSKPGIAYSSTNCYFDPTTGVYYSYPLSSASYIVSSSSNATYSTPLSSYRYPSTYSYYSYDTGMYYPNLNALKSVEGSNATYKTVVPATAYSSTYCYFNPITGSYTSSALNSSSYSVDYLYYYYGSDYYNYYSYYGYYDYTDPYFYYFLNKDYSSSSSSSSKDTTTATLGTKTGWTSIAKYLKSVASGSTATIDMNSETVVPASVMSAIKDRNVTVKLVLDNGVTFTVNGKDVTTAKDVDINTTYNTKSISTKLIKAAYKKNDAVSSAQLSIDAGTLGFNSDVTVKFSAKRSGYKAKLYRYNAAKNSLQLVDTATIGSTGKCNFDNVTKGGEFVIVIYK